MLNNLIFEINALISAMFCSSFFVIALIEKDEMEENNFNAALKAASVVTIISILIYCYYMLATGTKNITINLLFLAVDELSGLTLIFNFLEQKGIHFSIKLRNKKIGNIMMNISIVFSAVLIVLTFLKLNFFQNKSGFIRYDTLLLCLNFILVSILIPLFPNKKNVNREEVKETNKKVDKAFRIFYLVFGLFWGLFIIYVIYKLANRWMNIILEH